MTPSSDASQLVKQYEGCKLEAYQDTVGIATIGYGHTQGVVLGTKISQEQAEWFLQEDISRTGRQVLALLTREINQHQFDALVCFTFNVGAGNLQKSTLLQKINDGKFNEACEEFLRWNKAGGQVLKGLTSRRQAERALFVKVG